LVELVALLSERDRGRSHEWRGEQEQRKQRRRAPGGRGEGSGQSHQGSSYSSASGFYHSSRGGITFPSPRSRGPFDGFPSNRKRSVRKSERPLGSRRPSDQGTAT